MQCGPSARVQFESEQMNGLAAVAERQHEQARAAITARLRIADHRAAAVIDLCFFARRGDDDRTGLLASARFELPDEALDALVAASEAVLIHQVLIDGLGVAALLRESSIKSRCDSQALAEGLRPGVESGDVSLAGFELRASRAARRSVAEAASAAIRSGSNSAPKSGDTSLAGFEPAASGVAGDSSAEPVSVGGRSGAELAPTPTGFAGLPGATGTPRPQRPCGRRPMPAALIYPPAVSRRTPVSFSMRRSDQPSRPSAITCCRFSSLKTSAQDIAHIVGG